ncbi:MAG: NUDIX hydrolase, partial [Bacteroidota bacterium]
MEQQNIKIAVDAIVFGYEKAQLYVLLIKQRFGAYKNTWSLPGGFVLNGEGLTKAVERELKEEAGIEVDYLEQLYTFGDKVERDPRGQVISVAYFALVNPENLVLQADTDAKDAQWFPFDDLPILAYDHSIIIQKAIA